MPKESYYFSHDYEPTSDPKIYALIGEYGAVGYGLYWRIVEMLHSDKSHKLQKKKFIYTAIARQMLISVEQLETIVEHMINTCELFQEDDEFIWSERVFRNIERRRLISEKRSDAGKKSVESRLTRNQSSTSVEQVLTRVEQNTTKERKEKESKVNEKICLISFEHFWNAYDKKVGNKDKIQKKWDRLDELTQKQIIAHIEKYKAAQPDKQYRKNPETYLNNQSWLDEVIPAKKVNVILPSNMQETEL